MDGRIQTWNNKKRISESRAQAAYFFEVPVQSEG